MKDAASDTDRIEKQVTLRAPRSRVWRALTDHQQFGAWFRVELEGPFTVGATVRGTMTYPTVRGLRLELVVQRIDPETLFSYRWHPFAIDAAVDYSQEPTTLVEFHLADAEGGTLLTIIESGFDRLPAARKTAAWRANGEGWDKQIGHLDAYVTQG